MDDSGIQYPENQPPAGWRTLAQRLLGEAKLTPLQVAARAGVPVEQARRLWRVLGLPPVADNESNFADSDVAALRSVSELLEQGSTDSAAVVQVGRVIGRSMAQVAEAFVAAIMDRLTHLSPPAPLEDSAPRLIEALAPTIESLLGHVWRRYLLAALLRTLTNDAAPAGDHGLTIGFADLVGFTAISQQLDAAELAATVDRFEGLAYELIVGRGGRVVKMIGDEVMFAVDDGHTAVQIALDLVEACAADPGLPEVRVGLASGTALAWEGDLFGPTVNLASRLVNIARPGTVLASDALGRQLPSSSFELRHLRPLGLKGIGRVRFWVVRRRQPQAKRLA